MIGKEEVIRGKEDEIRGKEDEIYKLQIEKECLMDLLDEEKKRAEELHT